MLRLKTEFLNYASTVFFSVVQFVFSEAVHISMIVSLSYFILLFSLVQLLPLRQHDPSLM